MNRLALRLTKAARPSAEPAAALDLEAGPGPNGRTRLTRRWVAYPWSLGRAFPAPPGAPLLVLPQAAAAGLLAGDAVLQRVSLLPGASMRLASAGATAVHAGPEAAASSWRLTLDAGARLVMASEPHVLLPEARLSLEMEVEAHPSALFLGFEGVCLAGREGAWRSTLRVSRPDGPLFVDRQQAGAEDLARLARLPGAPAAFGTLLALAPPDMLEVLQREIPPGPVPLPGAYAACAPLRAGAGLAVRLACADGGALRRAGLSLLERAASALGLPPSRI